MLQIFVVVVLMMMLLKQTRVLSDSFLHYFPSGLNVRQGIEGGSSSIEDSEYILCELFLLS